MVLKGDGDGRNIDATAEIFDAAEALLLILIAARLRLMPRRLVDFSAFFISFSPMFDYYARYASFTDVTLRAAATFSTPRPPQCRRRYFSRRYCHFREYIFAR